jgi:hypothetical protein
MAAAPTEGGVPCVRACWFTVVLNTLPAPIVRRWRLASSDGQSHLITMPGITIEQKQVGTSRIVGAQARPLDGAHTCRPIPRADASA